MTSLTRPVPVFMYHHIYPLKGDRLTVTPQVFEEQMKFLSANHYRALTFEELISVITGRLVLKERAVALTFDDGWLDNHTYAFPLLKKYGVKATAFLITNMTEEASIEAARRATLHKAAYKKDEVSIYNARLTWALAKEMSESGLVRFYSHTANHRDCIPLSEDELRAELAGSKTMIGKRMGAECPYLCWPYGRYDRRVAKAAKKAGYRALVTTAQGVADSQSDVYAIKRIGAKDSTFLFRTYATILTDPRLAGIYMAVRKRLRHFYWLVAGRQVKPYWE